MALTHKPIEYILIHPNGREEPRSGKIWAQAPTTAQGRNFWVISDTSDGETHLVTVASRRHRTGRLLGKRRDARYGPRAGRWIDKRTAYAESHPDAGPRAQIAAQAAALAARHYSASDARPAAEYWPTFSSLTSGP